MNIVQKFLDAANHHPERKAIIEKNQSITYQQLQLEVIQTAAYFKAKGIVAGDRVLIFVPMGIDLYRVVLALFYMGATAVFLDEWVSKKRMELCCQIAECKGFIGIFKARIYAFFSKELRRIPITLSIHKKSSNALKVKDVHNDLPALITFTTGSTGTPKAALRSHGFLAEQFKALLEEIQPIPTDVDMPILPIVLFVNLGVGCTSVIAQYKASKPEKMRPANILQQIQKHHITRITSSPFFFQKIAASALANNVSCPSLSKAFIGGAPVFPSEAKIYKEAFPKAEVKIVYGSTEAEPISSIQAKQLLKADVQIDKGLHVGLPYGKADVRIIKISTEPIEISTEQDLQYLVLPEGEIGEIIIAGHHVLKTYYNNPEAFRANKIVINDTVWHRTGDSGFFRKEQLYLTGRCQQLIYNQGNTYAPFIIESLLQNIDGVSLGTMLQVKNKIIVVLESTDTSRDFSSKIPDFPYDKLVIISKIPRDPRHHSKIDYGLLRLTIQDNESI